MHPQRKTATILQNGPMTFLGTEPGASATGYTSQQDRGARTKDEFGRCKCQFDSSLAHLVTRKGPKDTVFALPDSSWRTGTRFLLRSPIKGNKVPL